MRDVFIALSRRKTGISVLKQWTVFYKNDSDFKKAMKANGEKFIGIANKEKVHNTYEISAEVVKEHGTLVNE